MGNAKKKIAPVVDSKELAKMKRKISKKIDAFKETILEGLTVPQEAGPLKEHLLPDPVEEAQHLVEEQIAHDKPVESEKLEFVPLVKPVKIEEMDIPGFTLEHVELAPLAVDISEPVELPVLNNQEPVDTSLFHRNPQARVFISGLDNQINSAIRVFLQKLGLQTISTNAESRNKEFIVEKFQQYNNHFDFAIVVLSPDDSLTPKIQSSEQGLVVSRQETVFELGYLVGKLGKAKVAIFYEESPKFKRPTEYFDLLYTSFDANGVWQKRLLNQLNNSGVIQEAVSAVS